MFLKLFKSSLDVLDGDWDIGVAWVSNGSLVGILQVDLGKGRFKAEKTIVGKVGLEFQLGQITLDRFGQEELAGVVALDVVVLVVTNFVVGFNVDTVVLGIKSDVDFLWLVGAEIEAQVQPTVTIAIDVDWVGQGVVFHDGSWATRLVNHGARPGWVDGAHKALHFAVHVHHVVLHLLLHLVIHLAQILHLTLHVGVDHTASHVRVSHSTGNVRASFYTFQKSVCKFTRK